MFPETNLSDWTRLLSLHEKHGPDRFGRRNHEGPRFVNGYASCYVGREAACVSVRSHCPA